MRERKRRRRPESWCRLGRRQDLGEMHAADGARRTLQSTADLQQAGVIRPGAHARPGFADCRQLVAKHGGRDIGVLHRERAAEAATFVTAWQLAEIESTHRSKQSQWLVADSERSQGMTRGVIRDGMWKRRS